MKYTLIIIAMVALCSCQKKHTWICDYKTKDGRAGIDTFYNVEKSYIKEKQVLYENLDCKKTNHNKW